MKIAVVGTGYVGLVAGSCFAESGNHVLCVDCDEHKIAALRRGEVPIYETGLAELVASNSRTGRLAFTTDLHAAVRRSRVIFIAVGTPPLTDGSADLRAILTVARIIGQAMDGYRVVVMKSTVPVGTHRDVSRAIREVTEHPFDYVSNPEFLKEGTAIEDFTRPDRVILGTTSAAAVELVKELYSPFMRRSERILLMDPASAELTKYAANAMLATRISFMNEMAGLCEKLGADVELVRRGIGTDARIGDAFLFAGVGFGGSCFPKDVSALVSMGESVGQPMRIVDAVREVNLRQREAFARRVIDHFAGAARPLTLAVWGLAFKSRTDDVRESPAIAAIRMFLGAGIHVQAHDPEATPNAAAELGDHAPAGDARRPDAGGPAVTFFADGYDALDGADALVVLTDWPKFRNPDFDLIAERLPGKVIFDGRNLYDPRTLARLGFQYHCVGRPTLRT